MGFEIEEKSTHKKLYAIASAVVIACLVIITALFMTLDVFGVKSSGFIEVSAGMTVTDISENLYEADLIKFPTVFRIISRINGYDTKIHTGHIKIEKGMSYKQILNELINAQPETVKVTIPEGYEINEIFQRLSEIVSEDEFNEALLMDYDYKFLKNLPDREVKLEGYLFPDTYEIPVNASAYEIICMMLDNFDNHFKDEYYTRAEELGMSVDDIITLASVVERESNSGEDRAKVAGVFYNRLKTNMRLQSCATVQYILKERKPVLSTDDTKINSPYNTYMNYGLPVGPIASPGEECIRAALYPEETNALYFVLGADGKHIFSETYEQHLNAKNNN